jgi:hypothetical protein
MAQDVRLNRRIAGVLAARLPETRLEAVADHRGARGQRWPLHALLRTVVVGCVAGCKSLAQAEHLTNEMAPAMRAQLRLRRRVPDTTMRDAVVGTEPDQVRPCLHRQIKAAQRRKALAPDGLPFGVVAGDGKGTAIPVWDDRYAQRQSHSSGSGASGHVRTMTFTLISSRAKVCLDAIPIPAATNETGQFKASLKSLVATYGGDLFRLLTYDAGACYVENAQTVRDEDRHYLFGLKSNQPTLLAEAERLLAHLPNDQAAAKSEDVVGSHTVTRRVFLTSEMAAFEWSHLQTVVRIRSEKHDREGRLIESENRYYLSSLPRKVLTDAQWLLVVRRHWGIENNCHHTWDTVFAEDDHPWIEANPQGTLVVMLLRRVAYNMLALFRSVTQRSEERRLTPWRDLVRWFYNLLVGATAADVAGFRAREEHAPSLA